MSWLHNELMTYFQDRETRHVYVDEFLNEWLATQIKVLREQRGLSQVELDDLAGLPRGSVNTYEDVTYFEWDLPTLKKLAEAFDVPLNVSFTTFGHRLSEMENFGRPALECMPFTEDRIFLDGPRPIPINQDVASVLALARNDLNQKEEGSPLPRPKEEQITAARLANGHLQDRQDRHSQEAIAA